METRATYLNHTWIKFQKRLYVLELYLNNKWQCIGNLNCNQEKQCIWFGWVVILFDHKYVFGPNTAGMYCIWCTRWYSCVRYVQHHCTFCMCIYIYIYSSSLRFDLSKVHLMFKYRMLFLYIVQYNCTCCIVVQYHCHFLTQCNIITQMW